MSFEASIIVVFEYYSSFCYIARVISSVKMLPENLTSYVIYLSKAQLSQAVAEIKKKYKLYGYNPKFL